MGKFIKSHWARLVVLTAAAYQIVAALCSYFWPKILFDFSTTSFNPLVEPIPILQTVNLILGILVFVWEWPLSFVAGAYLHRSIEARLLALPFAILASSLMYQSTEAAIFYMVGLGVYWVALGEGETSIGNEAWTLGTVKAEKSGSKGDV